MPNARVSMRGNLKGGSFYRVFFDAATEPALLNIFAGYIQFAVSRSHGNPEGTISGSSVTFLRGKRAIPGKLFIWRITFVSVIIGGLTLGVFSLLRNNGLDDTSARTIVVNTLVAGQIFYLSICRKIENQAMAQNSSRQYTG